MVKSDADTGTAQGDANACRSDLWDFRDGELIRYLYHRAGWQLYDPLLCMRRWLDDTGNRNPAPVYLLNDTIYEVGASPALYEVELNTTENQVTETVIYGNIQLVKHTDEPGPGCARG